MTLVKDRQGGAIEFGLADSVPIDVVAKDIRGLLPGSSNNGSAGEGDTCAVGKHPKEIGVKLSGLGAVALIDDDENRLICINRFD